MPFEYTIQTNTLRQKIKGPLSAVKTAPSTLTCIKCLHFAFGSEGLLVTGTDVQMHAQEWVDNDQYVSHEFLIPAKWLSDIVSQTQSDSVKFVLDPDKCKIIAGKSKFESPLESPESFPKPNFFNAEENSKSLTVNSKELRKMVRLTSPTLGSISKQGNLESFIVSVERGSAWIQTTDTHQITICRLDYTGDVKEDYFSIPESAIHSFVKSSDEYDGDVTIRYRDSRSSLGSFVHISAGSTSIWSALSDVKKLNLNQFVPASEIRTDFVINTEEFSNSLKDTMLANPNSVVLQFDGEKCNLSTVGENAKIVESSCSAESKSKKSMTIKVNPSFVHKALKMLESIDRKESFIGIVSDKNPILISSYGSDSRKINPDYVYVVSPQSQS